MTELPMPSLSDAMEEGTILTWLKAPGDYVDLGDELLEIETDKATMTYESPATGILEIVVQTGSTVPVGAVIARLGVQVAESVSAPAKDETAARTAPQDAAAPPPADAQETRDASAGTPTTYMSSNGEPAVRATPLARRLAHVHDIDLSSLSGSGPRGRVRRLDVERAAELESDPTAAPRPIDRADIKTQTPTSAPEDHRPAGPDPSPGRVPATGSVEIIHLTRLQQVIARRMSEAKSTIPEFQVETEVAFDAAIALRTELKEQAGDRAPSFNDLIIKACALALRDHPRVNASYRDGAFELHGRINIGMAVAAAGALVVPTIFDADTRSLGSIAAEAKRLAARVRAGDLTPSELSGGTFTVSNLGMYGMSAITPVINPPQAAILGVGCARALPALLDGELTERHVLTLRLSCDHRTLYGADAAEFLSGIRGYLEQPLTLVL